jgi:hypothetical protein
MLDIDFFRWSCICPLITKGFNNCELNSQNLPCKAEGEFKMNKHIFLLVVTLLSFFSFSINAMAVNGAYSLYEAPIEDGDYIPGEDLDFRGVYTVLGDVESCPVDASFVVHDVNEGLFYRWDETFTAPVTAYITPAVTIEVSDSTGEREYRVTGSISDCNGTVIHNVMDIVTINVVSSCYPEDDLEIVSDDCPSSVNVGETVSCEIEIENYSSSCTYSYTITHIEFKGASVTSIDSMDEGYGSFSTGDTDAFGPFEFIATEAGTIRIETFQLVEGNEIEYYDDILIEVIQTCTDECSSGQTGCDAQVPWSCVQSNGCWVKQASTACSSPKTCNAGSCVCPTVCSAGDKECYDADSYRECILQNGCYGWSPPSDCSSGYECTGSGSCTEIIDPCEPYHDHQVCSGRNVHWADACDNVNDLIEDCTTMPNVCNDTANGIWSYGTCESASCVYRDNTNCAANQECISGATCTDIINPCEPYHDHQVCDGSNLKWADACNTPNDLIENCALLEPVCNDDYSGLYTDGYCDDTQLACMYLNNNTPCEYDCDSATNACKACESDWSCGDWSCVNLTERSRICTDLNHCNPTITEPQSCVNTCIAGECLTCEDEFHHKACDGSSLAWYDECNQLRSIETDCSLNEDTCNAEGTGVLSLPVCTVDAGVSKCDYSKLTYCDAGEICINAECTAAVITTCSVKRAYWSSPSANAGEEIKMIIETEGICTGSFTLGLYLKGGESLVPELNSSFSINFDESFGIYEIPWRVAHTVEDFSVDNTDAELYFTVTTDGEIFQSESLRVLPKVVVDDNIADIYENLELEYDPCPKYGSETISPICLEERRLAEIEYELTFEDVLDNVEMMVVIGCALSCGGAILIIYGCTTSGVACTLAPAAIAMGEICFICLGEIGPAAETKISSLYISTMNKAILPAVNRALSRFSTGTLLRSRTSKFGLVESRVLLDGSDLIEIITYYDRAKRNVQSFVYRNKIVSLEGGEVVQGIQKFLPQGGKLNILANNKKAQLDSLITAIKTLDGDFDVITKKLSQNRYSLADIIRNVEFDAELGIEYTHVMWGKYVPDGELGTLFFNTNPAKVLYDPVTGSRLTNAYVLRYRVMPHEVGHAIQYRRLFRELGLKPYKDPQTGEVIVENIIARPAYEYFNDLYIIKSLKDTELSNFKLVYHARLKDEVTPATIASWLRRYDFGDNADSFEILRKFNMALEVGDQEIADSIKAGVRKYARDNQYPEDIFLSQFETAAMQFQKDATYFADNLFKDNPTDEFLSILKFYKIIENPDVPVTSSFQLNDMEIDSTLIEGASSKITFTFDYTSDEEPNLSLFSETGALSSSVIYQICSDGSCTVSYNLDFACGSSGEQDVVISHETTEKRFTFYVNHDELCVDDTDSTDMQFQVDSASEVVSDTVSGENLDTDPIYQVPDIEIGAPDVNLADADDESKKDNCSCSVPGSSIPTFSLWSLLTEILF